MFTQNKITIKSIVDALSSTVNTLEKITPLYDEVKPLIRKFIDIKKNIKNIDISKFKKKNNYEENIKVNDDTKKEEKEISSSPQFFI